MQSLLQLQPASTFSEEQIRKTLPEVNTSAILRMMQPMKNFAPCLWHKWDAHEHCYQVFLAVGKFMSENTPDFPLAEIANNILNQEIEGMHKWRILSLAGLLHDVGKGYLADTGSAAGHTRLSLLALDANRYNLNLTDLQFEFLRSVIENHHEFDRIMVSEDFEFTRRYLPKSAYLCESAIFTLFDMLSCQGPAYTDRRSPHYDESQKNIANRKRLITALLLEQHKMPDLMAARFN